MSISKTHEPNQQVATEAAEWFIELQAMQVSPERQHAFAEWLRRSPMHVEEFLWLTALHGDLTQLPELKSFDVEAELSQLTIDGGETNVVAFDPPNRQPVESPPARNSHRSKSRLLSSLAATVALVGIALWALHPIISELRKQHYVTDIGEQRSLTLKDGSQVQLNAVSKLSAAITQSSRELQLDNGEALFSVAKDPAHPFRVRTPQATIEAKGTQFNVHVRNGVTMVSLLEGHVLVTPRARQGTSQHAILLNPGEEIALDGRTFISPTPHETDLKAATAWTEHRLVFEDALLSSVIDEFNHYSRQPFVIDDAALRDMRITASFESTSTQTFADALAIAGNLKISNQPSGVWLIERK